MSLLQAGKFNIVPTLLNVGAGLALLGLVNIVLLSHAVCVVVMATVYIC